MPASEQHQTESPTHIEFLVDTVEMNLHCSLFDTKPSRDVFRRYALNRQASNLRLSERQLPSEVVERCSDAEKFADEVPDAMICWPLFSAVDTADTGDERLERHLLQDDRAGSELYGINDRAIVGCRGKEDHASRQPLASHTTEDGEGTVSWKVDVEDHDVRLMAPYGVKRTVAVGASVEYTAIARFFEDPREPAQHERMMTGHDQADSAGRPFTRRTRRLRAFGSSA